MKAIITLLAATLLTACASPTLTYYSNSELGNIEGRMVVSLPLASVTITRPPPEGGGDQNEQARPPADGARAERAGSAPPRTATAPPRAEASSGDGAGNGDGNGARETPPQEEPVEQPAVDGIPGGPSFLIHYEPNPDATFAVRPEDTLIALTEIEPAYPADSSVLTPPLQTRPPLKLGWTEILEGKHAPEALHAGGDRREAAAG